MLEVLWEFQLWNSRWSSCAGSSEFVVGAMTRRFSVTFPFMFRSGRFRRVCTTWTVLFYCSPQKFIRSLPHTDELTMTGDTRDLLNLVIDSGCKFRFAHPLVKVCGHFEERANLAYLRANCCLNLGKMREAFHSSEKSRVYVHFTTK